MKPIRVTRIMTLALLLPTLLLGQEPLSPATMAPLASAGPLSSTTVQIKGLGCKTAAGTDSFQVVSWSVNVTDLAVNKLFDECSPPLFGEVVIGTKPSIELMLTEKNSQNVPQMSIHLQFTQASTYQLVGSESNATPIEQLSFSYGRITITNLVTRTSFCYDKRTHTTC